MHWKHRVYHLYCYISPETGYFFPWTCLKAKSGPLYCCESIEKKKRKSSHRSTTSRGNGESGDRRPTHIVCDFLPEVGLCDEDLGDFLTGPVKHTSHEWVFVIPQSGFLFKVAAWENKWHHTQKIKAQTFSWDSHNESHDSPPDSCTIYRTNSSDLFSTLMEENTDHFNSEYVLRDSEAKEWIAIHPKLVKQQVKDLSCRHGAVYSYVGDWTIGRGKYRRLKKNIEEERFRKKLYHLFFFMFIE